MNSDSNVPSGTALARWETEGGALGPSWSAGAGTRLPLTAEEEHILERLGAAVLLHWNDLPNPIQRALFESATSVAEPGGIVHLKDQVARFLHTHKDDNSIAE
jgi:hypothetical protein